jgi:hypothetical protein
MCGLDSDPQTWSHWQVFFFLNISPDLQLCQSRQNINWSLQTLCIVLIVTRRSKECFLGIKAAGA